MKRVQGVAERYGVSEHTVIEWIHSGELKAVDVSRKRGGRPRWRITEESLEAFELSKMPTPTAPRTRTRKTVDDDVVVFY